MRARERHDVAGQKGNAMSEPSWLTIDELGVVLRETPGMIFRWMSERQLPGALCDGTWRFSRGHIDEWLTAQGGVDALHLPANGSPQRPKLQRDGG